jgi:endo-1,4-beta-xylanase
MKLLYLTGFLGIALATTGCAQTTLKQAYEHDFLIGAAVNPAQFCESNSAEAALLKQQFNSITPENALKWEKVHPEPGSFDFTLADRFVAFGESNQLVLIGHTLVWHSQTPRWVFRGPHGQPATREELLLRMREHIMAVVGRYRGRIKGWDVVNEAVAENGALRKTPWLAAIGEDYLVQAYQFAHAADPAAELYYNDYGLENPAKRAGALALIKKLQAAGVKIAGVGLQGHYRLEANMPTTQEVADTIADFAKLGVKVMITELDIDVLPSAHASLNADVATSIQAEQRFNPYAKGLPPAVQQQLAARYAALFAVFLKHRDTVERVTFWGVTDADSWLNNWPMVGRTSYPLLFDRAGRPKPAFDQVLALGHAGRVAATANPEEKTARNGKF